MLIDLCTSNSLLITKLYFIIINLSFITPLILLIVYRLLLLLLNPLHSNSKSFPVIDIKGKLDISFDSIKRSTLVDQRYYNPSPHRWFTKQGQASKYYLRLKRENKRKKWKGFLFWIIRDNWCIAAFNQNLLEVPFN